MARIAFLTISDMTDFVADDQLAVEPLARHGYEVESVPWDADVDWSRYRAAVIRSTWDYQSRMGEFGDALARIESSGCRLFNPLEVVRWNANKRYLDDLSERGVPVVPTLFRAAGEAVDLAAFFARFQCHDLVVKPTVGASAFDTFRVRNEGGGSRGETPRVRNEGEGSRGDTPRVRNEGEGSRGESRGGSVADPVPARDSSGDGSSRLSPPGGADGSEEPSRAPRFGGPVPSLPFTMETEERIDVTFRDREYMVQPFVNEIIDPGETSIFFFNGRYSHSILKRPKHGDFRVQEEHGGWITEADPPRDLVETCGAITRLFEPEPLYARVDIVRTGELFVLMELELIEPALYFRIVPGTADRFADALATRLGADG